MITRAYKTELDPNNEQATQFEMFARVRKFVFNVGRWEWIYQYEHGEKPSAYSLKKMFNAQKDELYPWVRLAPYPVTEAAFRDLGDAYKHFFRRVKNGGEPGFPKRTKRADHFSVKNLKVKHDRVRIQGLGGRYTDRNGKIRHRPGWVRLKERDYIPTTDTGLKFGTYGTISRRAGRWFISSTVEEPELELKDKHQMVVGVDFGIKAMATCSTGKVFRNSKPLEAALRKLGRLNKELARRQKGGSNWYKTKHKLQSAHKQVSDIRKHIQHQISHYLTYEVRPSAIVLEDLNVKGLQSNGHLSRAISDVGFYELRRQIEYKSEWLGIEVILADRWYPSSKTCSRCGVKNERLTLSDRTFICKDCDFTIDRDLNAALNLAALAKNRQTGGDCSGS